VSRLFCVTRGAARRGLPASSLSLSLCACRPFYSPPPHASAQTHHSKGQDINSVLFGGGSLAPSQQETLDRVKETTDKGFKL